MWKSKGKKEDELKQRRRGMKMKKKRNEEIEGNKATVIGSRCDNTPPLGQQCTIITLLHRRL